MKHHPEMISQFDYDYSLEPLFNREVEIRKAIEAQGLSEICVGNKLVDMDFIPQDFSREVALGLVEYAKQRNLLDYGYRRKQNLSLLQKIRNFLYARGL